MDISAKFILLGDSQMMFPLKWMLSPLKTMSQFLLCSTVIHTQKIWDWEFGTAYILCLLSFLYYQSSCLLKS